MASRKTASMAQKLEKKVADYTLAAAVARVAVLATAQPAARDCLCPAARRARRAEMHYHGRVCRVFKQYLPQSVVRACGLRTRGQAQLDSKVRVCHRSREHNF